MTAKADCRSLTIFLMCLLSVVKIRAQCGPPSAGENRVLTAESDRPTYSNGDTVTFQCSVGYKPADPRASKTVTCSGNNWDYSTLKLQCTKKTCGPLPDFANGRYTYSPEGAEGVLFGATATAQCNEGYHLLRYTARRCLDAGWDGREPVCEVIKCLPPPEVPNGQPDEPLLEEYEYGQAVTYECNAGYTRFGERTISCSNNGTFEPSPPECIKVSCDPPSVLNGKRIHGIPPYGYRSTVEFACDSGFKMVGSSSLVCDRNGWNPPPPTCTVSTATTTATTTTTTTTTTPTRPTSPAPKEETENPSPNNAGKIIGGVIGALGILGIIFGLYYYKKRSSTHGYSGNVAKNEEGAL